MLTDQDIARMKEVFPTKEDLKVELARFVTKEEYDQSIAIIVANMATKEDIADMVTKEDIADMATKEDIANMATKDDLKVLATKEDIADMVTKEDIADMATKTDIVSSIANLERRQQRLFDEFQEKFDKVMVIADRIFAPIDELRLEAAMSAAQYRRQVDWNHKVAEKVNVPFDY